MPKIKDNGWGESHRVQFNLNEEEAIATIAEKERRSVPKQIEHLAIECLAWREREKRFEQYTILRQENEQWFGLSHILDSIRRGDFRNIIGLAKPASLKDRVGKMPEEG